MPRETILIDADDTLWENNVFFEQTIEEFLTLLEPFGYPREYARHILNETERALLERAEFLKDEAEAASSDLLKAASEAKAENNFMPTANEIRPYIKGATLLSLCSPQNPTGTTMSEDQLEEICDMVIEENASRGDREKKLFVMYDQMYWHLTYGTIKHYNPVSIRSEMRQYTIFIDAISKVFAATGVRVGWSMGPETIINKMRAILGHVGAWAPMAEQKAVAKFLPQHDAIDRFLSNFRKEIEERLRTIYEGFIELKKAGFAVDAITPQAAIYLTIKLDLAGKTTSDGRLLETQSDVTAYILNEAKLAVVPFYAFGASRNSPWYRLSVGTCRKEEIGEMFLKLKMALQPLY